MPLQALKFKPGVNRENTRYYSESGWYSCNLIRFRQGTPESIGGWTRLSNNTYQGVCRSLYDWESLGGLPLMGVGTHLKFYVESAGAYYDITPIRASSTINNNPFATTSGSATVTVTDTAHGASAGDFVTFSGASTVAGLTLNSEFQIVSVLTADSYTITAGSNANATTSGGGASVVAAYQISVGLATATTTTGWGAGGYGSGVWGTSAPGTAAIRLWSQTNFGEDLVFCPRGGGVYFWDTSGGTSSRAVNITSLGGASNPPTVANHVLVADRSRFLLVFGVNPSGSSTLDPMLVRWADQESNTDWTPSATNQAGSFRLSQGSQIMTAVQSKQEIAVFTDKQLYSMQYVGAGNGVWGFTPVGGEISMMGTRVVAQAADTLYWMGNGTFYVYDGTVKTLKCDLLKYVFKDMNTSQADQFFAGTCTRFNEVWWFYCSATNNTSMPDRYVIYNYVEKVWYYGELERSAWLDTPVRDYPIAAALTSSGYMLLAHESSVDDNSEVAPAAINSWIESAEFDLDQGDNFAFVWRMVPDVSFEGSTASSPQITVSLTPLRNPGSGYGVRERQGVIRSSSSPVDKYTEQIYLRARGRQFMMRVEANTLGTAWQVGLPRADFRPDGKR